MKNLLKKSLLLSLFAFCVSFTGCQKEGYGDFALSVKKVGADYVQIFVTAPHALEMAYVVSDKPMLITPAVLFNPNGGGTVVTVNPGDVLTIKDGIFQDKTYHFYAVARLDDVTYSEKIEFEFTTEKYHFNDLVTIVETYYDGYKAHITVPEETKQRGHAIKMGSMPITWYNVLVSSKGEKYVALSAIASNGDPNEGYVKNDSTLIYNDLNVILFDENGDPAIDESTGLQIDIHDPMVPGEPTILYAGETRYGSKEEFNAVTGYYQPSGYSWSVPYYDPQTQQWLGAFQKLEFCTKEPSLSNATVNVEIPEDEITVTDAMIYFEMSEDAHSYFYMILDNGTYNKILAQLLGGREDYFQWFLTSYHAFVEWGVYPEQEDIEVSAAETFEEPLTGGETYHVLMTVFGDEEGASQQFIHKTFKAKEKTKVPPVIKVTPVPSDNPYYVTYNIKTVEDSRGNVQPIMGAYWVCNYTKDFEMMFNADYTYPDLLKNLGWTLTANEVQAVNSKEGLTLTFDTLDGMTTRFAIYGCNDEYTFNNIDEINYTDGWADYTAPMADSGKAFVDSPLFKKLEGDWTATARLKAKQQLDDESVVDYQLTHKSKITISASAPELPETLDESVYELYNNLSDDMESVKSQVNGMYAELKDLLDIFTEYRLEKNNRLLCTGFMDFDATSVVNGYNTLEYKSPYDLFVAPSTKYSSVDVPMLVYDFGPKWYIEVLEDGRVVVPFSTATMPPMINWPGYPFYVGAVGGGNVYFDATTAIPGFPVEVSEDYNTITIKPLVVNNVNCYMNAVAVKSSPAGSSYEVLSTVISDIVLTRGWEGASAKLSSVNIAEPSDVEARNFDGTIMTEAPQVQIIKSRSEFEPKPLPKYTRREKANVVTMEQVDASIENILKKFGVR